LLLVLSPLRAVGAALELLAWRIGETLSARGATLLIRRGGGHPYPSIQAAIEGRLHLV